MWINLIKIRSSAILRRFNHWAFLMLDRCQRLFFKNLFYEAARDSKSLNCNIIIKKRFFWHLSQLLTNLLFLPTPPQFSYFPFPSFFYFPSTTTTFLLFSLLLISAVLPPPPPLHFSLFSSSFSSSFYCFPSLFSSFLLFSAPFLLISIVSLLLISVVSSPPPPHFCCFASYSIFTIFT